MEVEVDVSVVNTKAAVEVPVATVAAATRIKDLLKAKVEASITSQVPPPAKYLPGRISEQPSMTPSIPRWRRSSLLPRGKHQSASF